MLCAMPHCDVRLALEDVTHCSLATHHQRIAQAARRVDAVEDAAEQWAASSAQAEQKHLIRPGQLKPVHRRLWSEQMWGLAPLDAAERAGVTADVARPPVHAAVDAVARSERDRLQSVALPRGARDHVDEVAASQVAVREDEDEADVAS